MTHLAALNIQMLEVIAHFYVYAIWQHILKHRNNVES